MLYEIYHFHIFMHISNQLSYFLIFQEFYWFDFLIIQLLVIFIIITIIKLYFKFLKYFINFDDLEIIIKMFEDLN
jgi:hypothetical protein